MSDIRRVLFFVFFISCTLTFGQGYYQHGIQYGIMTTDGKIVTPAIYDDFDSAGRLSEEHLVVSKDGKKGIVGSDGKQVGELKYDYASVFSRPLYEVKLNGKCGFVNKQGKEIIPCIYDFYLTTDDINEWYCMRKGDKYGMVDSLNNIIFPFEYSDINYYESGATYNLSLQKEKGGKYALANRKTEIITPFVYDEIKLLKNGGGVALKDTCYYFLSSAGKEIDIAYNSDDVMDMDYFVAVRSYDPEYRHKFVLYDYTGIKINSYKGYRLHHFSLDKIASISTKYGYTLIDTLGQTISYVNVGTPRGREFYGLNFYNGRAVARNASGKHGVIDIKGNAIVPFIYDDLELLLGAWEDAKHYIVRSKDRNEALLILGQEKASSFKYKRLFSYDDFFIKGQSVDGWKQGVISMEGEELTPFIYDDVVSANNYLATLELDNKIGFLNVLTGAKIDPIFDDWRYPHCDNKCLIVEKGDYQGVINSDCEIILDCIYRRAELTHDDRIIATNTDGQSAVFDTKGNLLRPFGKERLFYFRDNLLIFAVETE